MNSPRIFAICVAAWLSLPGALQAQQTVVSLVNNSGLQPSRYSLYVIGNSAASQKMLLSDGTFAPITAASGSITGYRIGRAPGEISQIILDRANPVVGARVYIVLVPRGGPAPSMPYIGSGSSVTQPQNPPSNQWPDGRRLIYGFIEITQPATADPTIDIQTVDGFTMPMNLSIYEGRRFLAAVGQPAGDVANRPRIISAYRSFVMSERISRPHKTAYLELYNRSGKTDGWRNGLVNPGAFLAAGANPESLLNTIWNPVLETLFQTPGRLVGMIGDDGYYYTGTPTNSSGLWYLDFVGYFDAECTMPNGNRYRVYSPLTRDPLGSYQPNESAGCMVFANDGVFANTSANAVISGPASVALGLQRDIVAAINRGVVLLGGTSGTNGENSKYWGLEHRWYPRGRIYNVFSRFMHTGTIGETPIFVRPRGYFGEARRDAQGALMGMAYGFAYDESPVHSWPTAPPPSPGVQPGVPSKFDPIPPGATRAVLRLGRWR